MKYKPYPAYKDSGILWLGEVPVGWEVRRLKYVARLAYGDSLASENREDGDFPVFGSNGQVGTHSVANTLSPMIVVGRKGSYGKLTYSTQPGFCIDTTYFIDERHTKENLRWLFYEMQPLGLDELSQDTGVPGLAREKAYEKSMPIPPSLEQSAIAAFLDRVTTKIDTLIAKQERLIELLQEKRTALISHAVTKGLNPDAPMKDSGVEWLGEVPAHWEVKRLKRHCKKITDGSHISPETQNGVYYFISTKDVGNNSIDFENCLRTSEASFEYMVRTGCRPFIGDVLFSKDGTIGLTVIVRENRDFVVASSLIIIRPNHSILDSEFLNYLCRSWVVTNQVDSFVKGAGLPRLSIQNLLKVIGIFPPIREQQTIATFLNHETAKIDTLIQKSRHAIDLLKERRTALISAAVTGKIDVRDEVYSNSLK